MPVTFASLSELSIAPLFLSLGCIACQTFAPHFQTTFKDKDDYQFVARPDFYHPFTNTFFEFKSCELNNKQSFRTADNRLRAQYTYRYKELPPASHFDVSKLLWDSKKYRIDCLLHAWNHSLSKHLIVQRALGTENYMVVFGNTLSDDVAIKYQKKGLGFLSTSQLAGYLTA